MTETPTPRATDPPAAPRSSGGLRLRLWLACLGGALATAAGVAWVLSSRARDPATDVSTLASWLAAVAGLGVLVGSAFALWLDRVIVSHLRGLVRGLWCGQVAVLRGLPAASGWGELSQITHQIQLAITKQRQAARAVEELATLRQQLTNLQSALDTWLESERWPEPTAETGMLTPVVESLNRGFERAEELREQNVDVVHQVGDELGRALEDARESAEQAEQGFVEATALLTTVRELQRLAGELGQVVETYGGSTQATGAETLNAWRRAAREAIEELVSSSAASVEHLGRGVAKVQDIAEQVHRLTNRSTLIALQASAPLASGAELDPEQREHIRRLVFEAREATDRTTGLVQEVREAVAAAEDRMRGVRERVAARFDAAPALPPARPVPAGAAEETTRLLERVREMIQDATRKGERLSAAGERVSRSAERLVRGLEEEIREVEGLAVRFAPPHAQAPTGPAIPPGAKEPAPPEPESGPSAPPPDQETKPAPPTDPGRFRLLGPEPPTGESPPRRQHEERT